ncbi:MAG: macro domain-containing protein [Cyanobacteriota bacterium]|nr:macro domain-containing protein [Cyanobacteriota bacterium]
MTQTPQIQPQIKLVPLRDAIGTDTATTQDVLLEIIPPQPDGDRERPPLNLGVVIDRSGSMQGAKIQYARQAASYAVEQLLPSDRLSITIYDDRIDTLVPSTPATNKAQIIRQIENIQPRGMTALHAGWVEGGVQVSKHLQPQHLNRVILLSDGLANRGETNPDVIASDVRGLAKRGVSTTTMGVGNDYNEDLLESMANSGDGNYYYIDSPEDLPDIFGTELQGIIATCGRNVRLRVEPQGDVELLDVFNDFELSHQGEYQLPNLVLGNPFIVALRLKVPPTLEAIDLCHFRLSWDDPDRKERQSLRVSLNLPVMAKAQLEELPFSDEVREQVALMEAARAKAEAVKQIDCGNFGGASQVLYRAQTDFMAMAPASPEMAREVEALRTLESNISAGRVKQSRKAARFQSHARSRSMHQSGSSDYYLHQFKKAVKHRMEVVLGDITDRQVDAIVNSTSPDYSGTDGLEGAIHRAAGPQLREACGQLPPCQIGEAQITPGFNLQADWVIHTVAPAWDRGQLRKAKILAQCYQNCLTLAGEKKLKTLAFPAIGTLSLPLDRAAAIAIETVVMFLKQQDTPEKVIFVCFDDEAYRCYQKAIG